MIALKSLFICKSNDLDSDGDYDRDYNIVFTFPGPESLTLAKMIPVRDQIVITKMISVFQIF